MIQPNPHLAPLAGLVPFVAPEALEAQLGVQFRARLGANESVFGAAPEAISAMQAASASTHNYGDPQSVGVRAVLSERIGGIPENYVVGAGIDGLLISLCRAYVGLGESVITSLGGYPTWDYAVRGTGATLVQIPYLENGAVDVLGLLSRAESEKAKLIYLACPDNPSGSLTPVALIETVLASLPADGLLVLDEAYVEFVPESQRLPLSFEDTRLLRLRTFSKVHGMAGARIGYAMGHPAVLEPLNRVRPHFEVSNVAQAGAIGSLQNPQYAQSVMEQVAAGRQELRAILLKHGLTPLPSHTNFITADVGSKDAAQHLLNSLLKAGVFIRKPSQPPLDRCVRITVGRPEDHAILDEALSAIRGQG